MKFCNSVEEELDQIISWISSEEDAIVWGGSGTRFPLILGRLKQDIEWDSRNSYSLYDNGYLVGFGQSEECYGCMHFSRIIVNPTLRGKGYGLKLVSRFLEKATDANLYGSLFVYIDNNAALDLYKRLGFSEQPFPVEKAPVSGTIFMKRMPNKTAQAGV